MLCLVHSRQCECIMTACLHMAAHPAHTKQLGSLQAAWLASVTCSALPVAAVPTAQSMAAALIIFSLISFTKGHLTHQELVRRASLQLRQVGVVLVGLCAAVLCTTGVLLLLLTVPSTSDQWHIAHSDCAADSGQSPDMCTAATFTCSAHSDAPDPASSFGALSTLGHMLLQRHSAAYSWPVIIALACMLASGLSAHGAAGYVLHAHRKAAAATWRFFQPFQARTLCRICMWFARQRTVLGGINIFFLCFLQPLQAPPLPHLHVVCAPPLHSSGRIFPGFDRDSVCLWMLVSYVQERSRSAHTSPRHSPKTSHLQGGCLFIVAQCLAWTLFAGGGLGALLATHAAAEAGAPPPAWAVASLGAAAMIAPFALSSSVFAFSGSGGARGTGTPGLGSKPAPGSPRRAQRAATHGPPVSQGGGASTLHIAPPGDSAGSPRHKQHCKSPRRQHQQQYHKHGQSRHRHRRRRKHHNAPECTCSADAQTCQVHGAARHGALMQAINMCAAMATMSLLAGACECSNSKRAQSLRAPRSR